MGSESVHSQILYDGKDTHSDLTTLKRVCIEGEREDECEERRVTCAILMISGSFETPRDQDIRVSDYGMSLELTMLWPPCITDFFYLHKSEIDLHRKNMSTTSRTVFPFVSRSSTLKI